MPNKHRYFPGGNTAQGFVSMFDQIVRPDDRRRTVILKGGPGVGKSTLIRRIGAYMEEYGFFTEWFHCASDAKSLDAVFAPQAGVLIADGTAPHCLEPALPGAADTLINLGVCLNEAGLIKQRAALEALAEKSRACYAKATRYLAAAASIRADSRAEWAGFFKQEKAVRECVNAFSALVPETEKTGRVRRLFAEAYTPDGKLSFLDTLEVETARQISTPQGVPISACTEAVLALVVARGWEAVALCDPLEPACISHVYVPELKLLLCTEPCGAAVPLGIEAFIKLSDASAQLALAKNETLTEQLISMAVEALNSARAIHQKTEQIYIEQMDFHKADAIADELFYNLKDWLTA